MCIEGDREWRPRVINKNRNLFTARTWIPVCVAFTDWKRQSPYKVWNVETTWEIRITWTNKMHNFLLIYFNGKPLYVLRRLAACHQKYRLCRNSNLYSHELCWLAASSGGSTLYKQQLVSYVYWTVHHLDSWVKKDQLYVTCFIISLFNAQHVSGVNTSILRSLRLICWVISWVVLLWFDVCWCYK